MTAFYGRKMLSISESIDDMEAYSQLSDAIYYQILYSTDPVLEEVSSHGISNSCRAVLNCKFKQSFK